MSITTQQRQLRTEADALRRARAWVRTLLVHGDHIITVQRRQRQAKRGPASAQRETGMR
jgi:hypothetical protein